MQKIPTDRKTLRHSRRATLDVSIPKENKNILTNQQKPKIPANKYLKERHSSTIYNNSVRPEQISPVDFECNEILEVISVPYKSNLNRELLLEPDQLLTPKGSSSFIQEVHGVQPPPPEYEPLEIEEVGEPSSLWKPENKDYVTSMIQKENEYMPNPFALQSIQTTLTENMRTILYDWMMEVSSEFTLKRETFHLAITYVDRFLSAHKCIKKEEFQLIGLVAMYIAAKVEEVYPPKISDWAKSADNGYTLASIKMMEKLVLNRLNWKIFPATIHNWANWLMNQ